MISAHYFLYKQSYCIAVMFTFQFSDYHGFYHMWDVRNLVPSIL